MFSISNSELPQKPQVIFVKQPDIIDAIADHGNAFDAEAERPPGPDLGIVADVFKHLRMHHAAAGDLEPLLSHLARERAGKINFETRFSIAEIVRAEADFHVTAQ